MYKVQLGAIIFDTLSLVLIVSKIIHKNVVTVRGVSNPMGPFLLTPAHPPFLVLGSWGLAHFRPMANLVKMIHHNLYV